jgi:hypothetical protein
MDIHLENNLRTTQHYLAQRDMTQQDSVITDTFNKEKAKLRNFIRKSVPNAGDADDILQDVFYEFVSAYRLPEPSKRSLDKRFRWTRSSCFSLILNCFRLALFVSMLPKTAKHAPKIAPIRPCQDISSCIKSLYGK